MTTYSSLKYDHPFSSNATGTGSLTLISSQTASASASISFTTGIDSTYDEYIFKFINIHSSGTNIYFTFNLSTDGGSNYNVTKTSTFFRASHDEADTQTSFGYVASGDQAQGTGYQRLIPGLDTANDQSGSGTLHLFAPSSNTFVKHFIARTTAMQKDDLAFDMYVAGYANTSSPINSVDFKFESGNIDDGTILMYGVK